MSEPVGDRVGVVDEYGSVWSGEPGVSAIIGDLVQRPDEETHDLHLLDAPGMTKMVSAQARLVRALQAHAPDDVRTRAFAAYRAELLDA